jgi:hypothetical protein
MQRSFAPITSKPENVAGFSAHVSAASASLRILQKLISSCSRSFSPITSETKISAVPILVNGGNIVVNHLHFRLCFFRHFLQPTEKICKELIKHEIKKWRKAKKTGKSHEFNSEKKILHILF